MAAQDPEPEASHCYREYDDTAISKSKESRRRTICVEIPFRQTQGEHSHKKDRHEHPRQVDGLRKLRQGDRRQMQGREKKENQVGSDENEWNEQQESGRQGQGMAAALLPPAGQPLRVDPSGQAHGHVCPA